MSLRNTFRALAVMAGLSVIVVIADPSVKVSRVADYLLLASAVISWIFTLLYATRSRWRLLNAGRSLLYVMVSLSIVLTQNGASVFVGLNYPGRSEIRLVEYAALSVALIGMVHTLWTIQRQDVAKVPRFRDTPSEPIFETPEDRP